MNKKAYLVELGNDETTIDLPQARQTLLDLGFNDREVTELASLSDLLDGRTQTVLRALTETTYENNFPTILFLYFKGASTAEESTHLSD